MNKVIISGNLVRDHAVSYTGKDNSNCVLRNAVASRRRFKNADGKYESDFISIVAFGHSAEFINKYFSKGSGIIIEGRIQTGSYTNKDGQKVYTTDVIVENAEFDGSKGGNSDSTASAPAKTAASSKSDGFMNIPDDAEELPFM